MNGTEKIIAHIEADAKTKADEILAKAKADADEILAQYKSQANEIYNSAINNGKKDSEAKIDSMKRMSEMESKKKTLAIKQEMVSEAFELAQKKILDLPKDDYVAFLVKLAKNASVTGKEEVVFNANDKEKYGNDVIAKANADNLNLTLSNEVGDFSGGLILRRDNIEVNCTLKLLIETSREKLSNDVVKILFEK